MAASNTRFTQNSLGQSKNPIDSDHGIYRDLSRSGFARSVKEHRRFVYSPRSCRLDGLALKRTQGQTNTRHYRIPSTLFFLRIGEIKAVDRAEGTARKIAAAVKNNPISLRG